MKLIIFFALICLALSQDYYSVEYVNYKYVLKTGKSEGALAWGYYLNEVLQDGWGKLHIWTSDAFDSQAFALKTSFAAGYLEAALTHEQIWQHQQSWYQYTFGKEKYAQELMNYAVEQDRYTRELIAKNPLDEYYQALARVTAQNDGIYQGIVDFAVEGKKLSFIDLLLLQACGDIYELKEAYKPKAQRIQWENLRGDELEWAREQQISCSSLVVMVGDWDDVLATHTTWTGYQNMLRIYKFYNFAGPKPYKVNFSAKPGVIYSKDDFYVLPNQKLVVMETTNGILDSSLYDLITPRSLLTWQRVPIANNLASNGEEWTNMFVRHNSGTYNNQYIVVDYKTFSKGKAPTRGLVWISETIPGFAKVQDVTQRVLELGGYWPSYNIPFDKEIYQRAGFQAKFEKEGDKYSYDKCPRGQIFARDAKNVKSLDDIKKFIRHNKYQTDQLSQNDPANAVANRMDLREKTNYRAFGAIDGKVASLDMVINNQAEIQSGPTHDDQPIFEWNARFPNEIHYGQPTKFDFGWVKVGQA